MEDLLVVVVVKVGGVYKLVSLIGFVMVVVVRDSFGNEIVGEEVFNLGVFFEIFFGWCIVCILYWWVNIMVLII